jgi:hypothetical protein
MPRPPQGFLGRVLINRGADQGTLMSAMHAAPFCRFSDQWKQPDSLTELLVSLTAGEVNRVKLGQNLIHIFYIHSSDTIFQPVLHWIEFL